MEITMNESECRKKVLLFLTGVFLFLGTSAILVYVFDPFFHYHKPWFGPVEAQGMKEYQIPGAIAHAEYDGILLGSSSSAGINTDILEQRFDCTAIKAIGNSAPAPVLYDYLNSAIKKRQLTYVFYGLDVFSFYTDPDMDPVPDNIKYLTNENPFDDAAYLWNGEILLKTIPNMIKLLLKEDYTWGYAYSFNQYGDCGPDLVLKNYKETVNGPWDYDEEAYVEENLNRLENIVADNPKTDFLFFLPPYSVMWWDRSYHFGVLDSYENTLKLCMERLLPYDNVKIYRTDFNNEEVITDLYQYMDVIHGGTSVTERMAKQIGDEKQEITLENYIDEITQLDDIITRFQKRWAAEGIEFIYQSNS